MFYVTARVCDAYHGNFTIVSDISIVEVEPNCDNDSHRMWNSFMNEKNAKIFADRIEKSGEWPWPFGAVVAH